jgi:hypothetical protein
MRRTTDCPSRQQRPLGPPDPPPPLASVRLLSWAVNAVGVSLTLHHSLSCPLSAAGGSRPVSRQAAKDHFTTTSKKAFATPPRKEIGSGVGMATMRPMTSSGPSRFNESGRPSDGRIHSRVNHFEPGADAFTYGGFEPASGRGAFGTTGARFVESSVVHQGLIDGYTAAEAARGIKPGRLVSSNATSLNNPLATSAYQVWRHG